MKRRPGYRDGTIVAFHLIYSPLPIVTRLLQGPRKLTELAIAMNHLSDEGIKRQSEGTAHGDRGPAPGGSACYSRLPPTADVCFSVLLLLTNVVFSAFFGALFGGTLLTCPLTDMQIPIAC